MCNFVKNMPCMLADARLSMLSDRLGTDAGTDEVLMYRDPYIGFWHRVGGKYVRDMVDRTCMAMLRSGIGRHDRIMVLSENMPECIYVSLAAYKMGVTVVPVFAGTSVARLEGLVRLTQSALLFAGGQEQYDMAAQLYGRDGMKLRIVAFDPEVAFNRWDGTTVRFEAFTKVSKRNMPEFPAVGPDCIADIIFTSGTTGEPKGVAITHGMYSSAFRANAGVVRVEKGWRVLEYLPYSHVFERAWAFFCLMCGATLAINRQPSHLQRALTEIRPDAMCCVPHFWEKVHEVVVAAIEGESGQKRELYERSLETGRRYNVEYRAKGIEPPAELAAEYAAVDKEVFAMLRRRTGLENARLLPTAGAVVSKEIEIFVRSCGLPIMVGYGLSETTATVSCDDFTKPCTPGSVGRIIDGMEIAFGKDNEIMLRGNTVARSYYRNREADGKAFSDGWFHTGDTGRMENGELFITGRLKHLMKTSNGKYVAPEQIEAAMNADPLIRQTVVVAEGRKFVSALIVPRCPLPDSVKALRELKKAIWQHVEEKQKNQPPYCQIKRILLLGETLTVRNGCLTSTLKIRRGFVEQKFADEINTIYDNKKYRRYDNLRTTERNTDTGRSPRALP